MKKCRPLFWFVSLFLYISIGSYTQLRASEPISFTISMPEPASHIFHVRMNCSDLSASSQVFNMPAWTPGYYQILNFGKNLTNLKVSTLSGKTLEWNRVGDTSWIIKSNGETTAILEYDILATRSFVATPFLDSEHGYILPAGVFLYPAAGISRPSIVTVVPFNSWKDIGTGLPAYKKSRNSFYAKDFDILYDSPILVGNLEELPSFKVKGVKHRFIGYKLGDFDKVKFMSDLKKIVQQAVKMMGEVPYKDYTFIGIGPGAGGIEHLNSTTVSFNGKNLSSTQGQLQTYFFLAHEYFHNFNVKRIRPIELGPFDYEKPNRSDLLWLAEGVSVYYEYVLVKRAGICSEEDLFARLRSSILGFEGNYGRLYQTLTEASYNIWDEGPFGRQDEVEQKTISIYDKGAIMGWLLDFTIRHATGNKKSMDDVMRSLYSKFYKAEKRGFSFIEFKKTCEAVADSSLADLFTHVYTTREIDYRTILGYAGLNIDYNPKPIPGAWLGATTLFRNDSCIVDDVEWLSAAWGAGLRKGFYIEEVEGKKPGVGDLVSILSNKKVKDSYHIVYNNGLESKAVDVLLGEKTERLFNISIDPNAGSLEKAILKSWLQ